MPHVARGSVREKRELVAGIMGEEGALSTRLSRGAPEPRLALLAR
jgi:hypothetical protein